MQLKRSTDVLLRILIYLAAQDKHMSVSELAEKLNWNKNLVVKVTHTAVQQGWLIALRGRSGGLKLAKPPQDYRLGDIVRFMEDNEELINCDEPLCPLLDSGCRLRGVLWNAQESFYRNLNEYSLADLLGAPLTGSIPVTLFAKRQQTPSTTA